MAAKAKLSLSQLLFRRSSTSSNSYANANANNGSNGVNPGGGGVKSDCGSGSVNGGYNDPGIHSGSARKMSCGTVSSGKVGFYDFTSPPTETATKVDSPPQLQGILKKPRNDHGDTGSNGKISKSTLQRSRSNPNPSNNPLKEVSWSCPTLEKRREVILNYFERIILENKQEQQGTKIKKPNIPPDGIDYERHPGEPIYEEISDHKAYNVERTGSLKPKVMPKKVRMNIPQDQVLNSGGSPIYDKLLCRSHSMLESNSNYDIAPPSIPIGYERHEWYDHSKMRTGRSHSFHENFRSASTCANGYKEDNDMDLYAKVCKRKKKPGTPNGQSDDQYLKRQQVPSLTASMPYPSDDLGLAGHQVDNVVMIPVIMPSSFSTSCLSLSSSDNNHDESRHCKYAHDINEETYTEKILPDKDITYAKYAGANHPNGNNNNLSINLLAKDNEGSSFTAIIDSTESAPKSISVPVRCHQGSSLASNQLLVPSAYSYFDDDDGLIEKSTLSTDEDDDDHDTKYKLGLGQGVSVTQVTSKDLLLTSDSEDETGAETKSILDIDMDVSESNRVANSKYITMDDEDRGFDSFLDENDNGFGEKEDNPFKMENLKNQRTFAQTQQDVPNESLRKKAASVLDLINSEISDLHMRELELKKLQGSTSPLPDGKDKDESGEEFEEGSSEDDFSDSAIEFDGFTTNGSNSSGQVSPSDNLNDLHRDGSELSPIRKVYEDDMQIKKDKKVRPLIEEETKPIEFRVAGETPIEREIRLTREREEEFKRVSVSNKNPEPVENVKPKNVVTSPPVVARNSVLNRPESFDKPKAPKEQFEMFPDSFKRGVEEMFKKPVASQRSDKPPKTDTQKNGQYEIASARFKREIEETMNREKALLLETRRKRGESDDDSSDTDDDTNDKLPQAVNETASLPIQPSQDKPSLVAAVNKISTARFFSPPAYNANKPNRITPVISPIISRGNLGMVTPSSSAVGGSLPIHIDKPNFTSMEKFMLQSRLSYTPSSPVTKEDPARSLEPVKAPQPIIPEDPLRIIQKPNVDEDVSEENKEVEEERPKRRYIPAQDKIQKEIEELAKREKELTITRAKWKSTLDIPEALDDDDVLQTQSTLSLNIISRDAESVSDESTPKNIEIKRLDLSKFKRDENEETKGPKPKAPARRRHSVLINQWEERIRQQQQTVSKK